MSVVAPPSQSLVAQAAAEAAVTEMVIEPRRGWIAVNWAEIWQYRELLYFLVWRDLKVRYKQTVLGIAWAVLQPLLSTFVFTIIFGQLAKIPSSGFPYAVFVYAGLLPFSFFQSGVNQAGLSLINQQNLLTKIYFPRLFVPTASIGAGLVDMTISFGVYAVILGYYHFMPSWQVVFIPGLILLTILATLGLGYLLAALTVTYRDFRYVIPFMLQIFMYASPVVFPVTLVPEQYRWILALNPLTGIIDGYRSAILGQPWHLQTLGVSIATTLLLFTFGLFYFRKTERRFADIA